MARDADGIIPIKYANSGDVGLGGLDLNELWTITYSTPGGLFPQRIQFNQLFRNLSALAAEINTKGPYLEYSALVDYQLKSQVLGSNNIVYSCNVLNGPATSAVDPVGDTTGVWSSITKYSPDWFAVDQGSTGNNNTLKYYIDTIGSDQGIIVLRHDSGDATTTYTLTANETVPANVTLQIEPGAIIDGVGTLTFAIGANFTSGSEQCFGNTLDVTGLTYADTTWFGAAPSASGAVNAAAIQSSHDALGSLGGVIYTPGGSYPIGALSTFTKDNITFYGDGAEVTIFACASTSFLKVDDTGDDLVSRYNFRDFAAYESGTTTSKGIEFVSYPYQQNSIERLRLYGFGGGELIIAGGNNLLIDNNYLSHNRAGSTGSALKIIGNTTTPGSFTPTSNTISNNYFASTVAGADPMVLIEDTVSTVLYRNIYENVPVGVVGLRVASSAGNESSSVQAIGEHFEGVHSAAFEVHDVTNFAAFGTSGLGVTYTWSEVAAADRYPIDMGSAGEPDLIQLRRALFGLRQAANMNANAAIQVGPIRGAGDATMLLSSEGDAINEGGIIETWGQDNNDQTPVRLGYMYTYLETAHATLPGGAIKLAVRDAGLAETVRLQLDSNGVTMGEGSTPFKSILFDDATWDPGNILDGEDASTTIGVAGAQVGMPCFVGLNTIVAAGWFLSGSVTSAGVITLNLLNMTGGAVDLGSGTARAWVLTI